MEELGLLPAIESSDEDTALTTAPSRSTQPVPRPDHQLRGAPWFEEMVKHTALGHMKQQRGGHTSPDGSVKVEWEVVEWTEGDGADDEGATPAKRKIGQVEEGEDTDMRTA